ncbi:MAG: zf-HC2 domain-containing protein [Candidatus Omnitrophica bacterium]|nr:zf-HC2 domain-containing protein [Candidatus Omnitrophota bacterium]
MDCQKIKKLIPIYLDKELEPKEMQAVREHLAACLACQKELKAFEESWAMLGDLNDIHPKPGFVGRFWKKMALEQSWQEKIIEAMKNSFFKKPLIPALVTACMIVIAGSFVFYNYSQMRGTNQLLAKLSQEDLEMFENIKLAENLDLIEEIDFLEDFEIVENLDILETLRLHAG